MREEHSTRTAAAFGLQGGSAIAGFERGVEGQVLMSAEHDVQAGRSSDQSLIAVEAEVTERHQYVDLWAQTVDLGLDCGGSRDQRYSVRVINSSQAAGTRRIRDADHPYPQALRVEHDARPRH